MRIAICDDDRVIREQLAGMIRERYGDRHELVLYSGCAELTGGGALTGCDLLFVDIELGDGSGIDAVRQVIENGKPAPVFITSYIFQYAEDIFVGLSPYGYVGKPLKADRVCYLIDKMQREMDEAERYLVVTRGGVTMGLRMADITVVESDRRQALIRCRGELVDVYEKLDEIESRVDGRFVRCHKSFLVNLEYVARLENEKLVLSDGTEAPVSRANADETRRKYFAYKGRTLL